MHSIVKFITILLGVLIYIPLFLLLSVFFIITYFTFSFHSKLQRNIIFIIKRSWLRITLLLMFCIFPKNIKLAVENKKINKNKTILISNHISNFDWIFIMRILYELSLYDDCYFIMKESLGNIPFIGFSMRVFGFIFLKRKWEEDKSTIENHIKFLEKNNFCIVIFPEGTFLDEHGVESMEKFISQKKLEDVSFKPSHTLYPRVKGFNEIVNLTKSSLDCIIDITLIASPYKKFPASYFDFYNTFVFKPHELEMSAIIEFHEIDGSKNFLINKFRNKNVIIKNIIDNNVTNLKQFKDEVIKTKERKYTFKEISFNFLIFYQKIFLFIIFLFFIKKFFL